MAELKIVYSEHQDYQRQGRVHLDLLRQSFTPIPPRLERILPNRSPSIEAVFNHPHRQPGADQASFDDSGPTLVEAKPFPGVGDNSPRQGVAIYQDVLHKFALQCTTSAGLEPSLCAPL